MALALSSAEDLARVAERIRDGDPSAEDELVRQFSDRVRLFVSMRTRDRELAHDLGQEIMINVLTALRRGQLRDPERLAAFVFGTARNVVNNHFRTDRVDRSEPLPPEIASTAADQADEFEAAQRQSLVRRALARVSRDDRVVLLLTLVDGLKPGEIAFQLGLTAEVVRARKSRALKRVVEQITSLSRKRDQYHMITNKRGDAR
jgi:RNA polymerase sigma factor (sigma-70 family)